MAAAYKSTYVSGNTNSKMPLRRGVVGIYIRQSLMNIHLDVPMSSGKQIILILGCNIGKSNNMSRYVKSTDTKQRKIQK